MEVVDRGEVADADHVRARFQFLHELPFGCLERDREAGADRATQARGAWFCAASCWYDEQSEEQQQRQGVGGESNHHEVLWFMVDTRERPPRPPAIRYRRHLAGGCVRGVAQRPAAA